VIGGRRDPDQLVLREPSPSGEQRPTARREAYGASRGREPPVPVREYQDSPHVLDRKPVGTAERPPALPAIEQGDSALRRDPEQTRPVDRDVAHLTPGQRCALGCIDADAASALGKQAGARGPPCHTVAVHGRGWLLRPRTVLDARNVGRGRRLLFEERRDDQAGPLPGWSSHVTWPPSA